MNFLNVATASLNQTPLDWDGNQRRIVNVIREAKSKGVQLLCLPELCVTGYGCEDAFLSRGVQAKSLEILRVIAKECEDIVVCLGLPLKVEGKLFNTVALVVDGDILGFVGKQNLAGEGIYYEPRWFKPWPKGEKRVVPFGMHKVPVGDLIFDIEGIRIGFEICEDGWVAERPATSLLKSGVDLILNPSASHFAFGKNKVRRKIIFDKIKKSNVVYITQTWLDVIRVE